MFKKTIERQATIPRFYGKTYIDYAKNVQICHIMPLNLIVRLLLNFKFSIKKPKKSWWEKKEKAILARLSNKYDRKLTDLEFENLELKTRNSMLNLTLSKIACDLYTDEDCINH